MTKKQVNKEPIVFSQTSSPKNLAPASTLLTEVIRL